MGIKRIVDTAFWTDGKVDEFSPEDKYFMLYLLTNPFSTQLGIYEISIKQVAFQLGYSMDAVKVLIERFESKYGIIVFSKETNEIAIMNFLRHSIIKGGAPVRDCLIKEMKKVKNKSLISSVFSHIKGIENLNETVKKIISEYEDKNGILHYSNEKQNDNANENENENDVSCHDSCNDTFKGTNPHTATPTLDDVIEYCKLKNYNFAQKFFSYYQSVNWLDKNGKPFDWRSKADYWNLCDEEKKPQKPRYGNFDPEEAFQIALNRSFPEESKESPKTLADDEDLRKRADALREKIGMG